MCQPHRKTSAWHFTLLWKIVNRENFRGKSGEEKEGEIVGGKKS